MSKWKTVIENNNYEINEQGKIRRKETKHILKPAYKSKWEYVE